MDAKKITYDQWANKLTLEAIKTVEQNELKAELTKLFAHLFKAQIIIPSKSV